MIYFNLLQMNSLIKEMYMHSNFLEMKKKINNFFIKCINYYQEIDNNINDQLNTSNILLCGQCGAWKSTFINNFIHEKVAKEGEYIYATY